MPLSTLIKEYREKHHISIRELANQTNLSAGYIHKLEKGIDPRTNKPIIPTVDTINKLSLGMNIPTDELLLSAGVLTEPKLSDTKSDLSPMQINMINQLIDLVIDNYEYNDIFFMFLELDLEDKAEIKGEMKQMLKSDKYLKKGKSISKGKLRTD